MITIGVVLNRATIFGALGPAVPYLIDAVTRSA
jgi:hypothetical protein